MTPADAELIERLRRIAQELYDGKRPGDMACAVISANCSEAADALAARSRRIADLVARLAQFEG